MSTVVQTTSEYDFLKSKYHAVENISIMYM